jgi:hypothetical protein
VPDPEDVADDVPGTPDAGAGETTSPLPTQGEADHAASTELDPAVALETWRRATGAFALGALDADDVPAALETYRHSPELQHELQLLLPVVDILTSLYQPAGTSPDQMAATAPVQTAPAQPAQAPSQAKAERVRERAAPVVVPKHGGTTARALPLIALGILAALGLLWGLAQRDLIATRDREISALQNRIAELEQTANAGVLILNPVSDDAAGAKATIFYSVGDGTVLINATGFPEIDENDTFQIWLQTADSTSWQPGPSFRVNEAGEAVRRLPGEVTAFSQMAISVEPQPGSAEPTTAFLLQGEMASAQP